MWEILLLDFLAPGLMNRRASMAALTAQRSAKHKFFFLFFSILFWLSCPPFNYFLAALEEAE